MKRMKWFPLLAVAFALTVGFVSTSLKTDQAAGVEFFHGTIAEAQAKAKSEGKLIFVDSYTVWCGPCKYFSANVLTNPDVAALYNSKFINLKVDIENGEGPAFAQKYSVVRIPTLLFLNGDGKVMSQNVGAMDVTKFLDWGRQMAEYK